MIIIDPYLSFCYAILEIRCKSKQQSKAMKTAIASIILMAFLSIVLASCSFVPPKELQVDETYSGKEVTLSAFATLTVTLPSDPSSRYQWDQQASISNTDVLQQASYQFKSAAGTDVWTFTALQAGTATILLKYRLLSDPSFSAETFNLKVVVK